MNTKEHSDVCGTVTAGPWIYTLHDDRRWSATLGGEPDPIMAHGLDAQYPNDWDWYGPHMGRPGAAVLHDLATKVDGSVWMPPKAPPKPGTVY